MVKKLKQIEVEEKLKALGMAVFTPKEFRRIFNVSEAAASGFISNNLSSGLFLKLRNGFYMVKDSNPSHYFIANQLYSPSYISLETALSHYGIIPEVAHSITSVTAKAPREFNTPIGVFSYQKIKNSAFGGYYLKHINNSKALFAKPEKALADYLYFVDLKKIILNNRIELKNISKNKLIDFAKEFNRPNMKNLIEQIYDYHRKPRKIY